MCSFETRCIGSIKKLTLCDGKPRMTGEIIVGLFRVGSQLLPQISTTTPIPILQEAQRLMTSLSFEDAFPSVKRIFGICCLHHRTIGEELSFEDSVK